jgi:hypothetical protein
MQEQQYTAAVTVQHWLSNVMTLVFWTHLGFTPCSGLILCLHRVLDSSRVYTHVLDAFRPSLALWTHLVLSLTFWNHLVPTLMFWTNLVFILISGFI